MPWQDNGDCYCFKEEEIKVHAPAASGVYGLYDFRHQITIGNSANIREALLRHLRDSNRYIVELAFWDTESDKGTVDIVKFRFRRFEPTGFTFEVCPKDSRDIRMQQLILEYNPITQSRGGIGLRSLWRSWMTPSARAFHSQLTLTREEYHQKHVPGETKAAVMKPFIDLLAGAICSILLLVALFAMLPNLQSSARMVLSHISSVMHRTPSAEEQARVRSLTSTRETEIAGERSTNGPRGLENDRDTQQQSEKGIDQFAAESNAFAAITPPENSVSDTVKAAPMDIEERGKKAQLPSFKKTEKHWAVQLMATPDRGIATVWMEKLNAKGYDAFVVEAKIDGKTWYRVRLGNFETLRDAETLSALVRLKEGFHDAFVAASTKSEIVALERLR